MTTPATVIAALQANGILLESDPRLPSVVTMVAGGPVRGSWWAHPRGQAIYHLLSALEHDDRVLMTKLVSGKTTLVHRRLWPQVLTVGCADRAWKRAELTEAGRRLLQLVRRRTMLCMDEPVVTTSLIGVRPAAVALDLERRLLAHGSQRHTERGAHVKCLETWRRVTDTLNVRPLASLERAMADLDAILRTLNERYRGTGRFPWWGRRG